MTTPLPPVCTRLGGCISNTQDPGHCTTCGQPCKATP